MTQPTSSASTGEELAESLTRTLDARLAQADAALVRQFPGDTPDRQPVHTVYVPANAFTERPRRQPGERRRCPRWTEHSSTFAGLSDDPQLVELVRDKLRREPIEDVRIDFEDGYGAPGDEAEDARRTTSGGGAGGRRPARVLPRRSVASGSRASRRRPGVAASARSRSSSPSCSSRAATSRASS